MVSLAEALARGPLGMGQIPGSVLGPYLVERELGRGAFGAVFLARHAQQPGPVALKVLVQGAGADATTRARFLREAGMAAARPLPGVVRVLDAGEADGLPYLALEYVDGPSFAEALEGLSLGQRVGVVRRVAEALAPLHAEGVVHRDLKPENVLLRASGEPVLADFGLARDLALSSSLTHTGDVVGTPAYMAPEQIKGKELTPAADVFALGVMLYRALTGEPPFKAANLALQYAAIVARAPTPPSKLEPDVPPGLDPVVLRALDPKPEQRFATAGELAAALRAASGEPSGEHLAAAAPRSSGKLVGGLLLGALVLAGASTALALALRSGAPEEPEAAAAPGTPSSGPAPAAGTSAHPTPRVDAARAKAFQEVAITPDPAARLKQAKRFLRTYPGDPGATALVDDLQGWRVVKRPKQGWPRKRDGARCAFCWAAQQGGILLFGGWDVKRSFNDLWRYDGTWKRLRSPYMPPERFAHAMAWDSHRGHLVMFGGRRANQHLSFLWEWNGTKWGIVAAEGSNQPAGRSWHGMAYDPERRRVVMFGGETDQGLTDETWTWDGRQWALHTVKVRPRARAAFGMTWDPLRAEVVLFGGNSKKKLLNDVWTWNGSRWRKLVTHGKRPRPRNAMGWVHDGRRLILFGGGSGKKQLDDTWALEGDRWKRLHPVKTPKARLWHAMAYDPRRRRVVVFGGSRNGVRGRLGAVWEYPTGPRRERR